MKYFGTVFAMAALFAAGRTLATDPGPDPLSSRAASSGHEDPVADNGSAEVEKLDVNRAPVPTPTGTPRSAPRPGLPDTFSTTGKWIVAAIAVVVTGLLIGLVWFLKLVVTRTRHAICKNHGWGLSHLLQNTRFIPLSAATR